MTTRNDLLQYVSHALDDSLNVRTGETIPDEACLVVWQCGFEPQVVAVWSYLPGCRVDAGEAEHIAMDYLVEIGWFCDEVSPADFTI